jgi:hypothetical protein
MKLLSCFCSLGDSEVFGTTLVKRILSYKWLRVRKIGYFLTIMYILYLVCLSTIRVQTITEPWHIIVGWAGYFILIEVF